MPIDILIRHAYAYSHAAANPTNGARQGENEVETAHDRWLTETPEDYDDRMAAREANRENRSEPAEYRTSDYDRMIPQTYADGKTVYVRVNMLDYIQE